MSKKLLLIGGGGHCHSVLDSVLALNEYDDIGIIDSIDNSFSGISVIGTDEDVPKLFKDSWKYAFITVGSIGNTEIRKRLYKMIKEIGLFIPTIIDSTAVIGANVTIDEGTFIGKRAIINTGSKIGTCSIINTGAIIEHDCIINNFSHISPGAILCGQVTIGNDTHIGAGTTVKQLINIGNNTLIGAGSVVVSDIPSNIKAYGNPCKVVE